MLLRESRVQPLLLVCEDLHWIDAETQALLDGLVEALPTARILLLINYRPEYSHAWGGKSFYTQLRIDPLGQASAEELLGALLGADPSTEPLRTLLIERTEGNPFFLEESVQSLVEAGTLVGERGAYRPAGPLSSVRVPATVQAVLAARIDRLPPAEKRLLQTAAVIGKDVPFALLQAIAETPDADLQAGLSRLQAAELLYAVSLFPDLELTFKHALTHEVAYGSLLQERRRALHARIVDAIETLYPDRLEEQVERLAHHAARGHLWEKAIAHYRQAGEKALGRSAGQEAVRLLTEALEAAAHRMADPGQIVEAIDLRLDLCVALFSLAHYHRAEEHIREAEALAEAISDQHRLGCARVFHARFLRQIVNHQAAIEAGERAIVVAKQVHDLDIVIAASDLVGTAAFEMGRYEVARGRLGEAVALLTGDRAYGRRGNFLAQSVASRQYLAFTMAWQGDFQQEIAQGEESWQIAQVVDHGHTSRVARDTQGLVYAVKGDAEGYYREGLAIAEDLGMRPLQAHCHRGLGKLYRRAGRPEEARSELNQAIDLYLSMEMRHWLPEAEAELAAVV